MKVFFNNLITFINNMDTFLKVLFIGMLIIIDVLALIQIIKTHVNPKKFVFKLGQFLILALFVALTIFVCAHA